MFVQYGTVLAAILEYTSAYNETVTSYKIPGSITCSVRTNSIVLLKTCALVKNTEHCWYVAPRACPSDIWDDFGRFLTFFFLSYAFWTISGGKITAFGRFFKVKKNVPFRNQPDASP